MSKTYSLLFFWLILASCSTTHTYPARWIDKNASFAKYKSIHVSQIVDETGNRYKYDLPEMIRGVVIRSLDELGHILSKEPSRNPDTLVVDIRIVYFQPGNAFARWVLGGYAVTQEGTITKLTIRLAMKDSTTNRKIYDSVIHADTFGGLAGGPGDDKKIITDVGKDIAKEIDTALRDAQS